jgi:hypothetical protein
MPIVNALGQTKFGVRVQSNLLLDYYTNSLAAYSFRKLKKDYTGPCLRVRRSSDNTEMDIPFNSNNEVNETAILNFVGSPNKLTYSQDFTNAVWTKSGVTITADQGLAPDGTQTADLYSENSGSGNHYMLRYYPNVALNTGYNWNSSFYIKKSPDNTTTNNKIIVKENLAGGAQSSYVEFNLDTGTYTISRSNGINIIGAQMTDVGNGWWRCSMYGDVLSGRTAGQIPTTLFRNGGNNGAYAFTGDTGAKYYIWGMQVTGWINTTSGQNLLPYTPTTFGYGGDGFISKWYDQSGNGRDVSNILANGQPYIVWEGNILKSGSKVVLKKFTIGTNSFGNTIVGDTSYQYRVLRYVYGSFTITKPLSVFTVTKYDSLSNQVAVGGDYYSAYTPVYLDSITNSYNYIPLFSHYSSGYMYANQTPTTNKTIKFLLSNAGSSKMSVNNGTVYTGSVGNLDLRGISIGAYSYTPYVANEVLNGEIQEVILWNTDQSTNRLNILNNMNTYYQVY